MGAINTIATIMAIKGARLNNNLSAPFGVNPSFTINFIVSASDWNIPFGPTRFGPNLICIQADTFLSMITNINPSMANKPITHTPTMTISEMVAHVGLNVLFNQVLIVSVILDKLHMLCEEKPKQSPQEFFILSSPLLLSSSV